jgi:hypothetical protein
VARKREIRDQAEYGFGEVDKEDRGQVALGVADATLGAQTVEFARSGRRGMMIPREGGVGKVAMEPGTAGGRVPVLERQGPRFRTEVRHHGAPPVAPESVHTQANGRMVASVVNRQRENFWRSYGDQPR